MQSNVYECINISNVINKLHLKKTYQLGTNIYVNCPFCQNESEKSGYMKVNTIKNLYICDNCESTGTAIDLYAKIKYISTKDAFKQLLKEVPILDDIPYTYNNPIKDEYYRDLVYTNFLDLQVLNKKHKEKLENMNFTEEYIIENKFKSIENRENRKKEICYKLQEQGLKLDGISGFYQDTDFKWTYKSHQGIFIPVVLNNKIQGLRIFLDDIYKKDTENIWFSSNYLYNGTKANNWSTVLKEKTTNWIDMYNSPERNNSSIIVATEIILAHQLFNKTHKIVIGIPNNIEKDIILNIVNRLKANEVFLYIDNYTIRHTSTLIQENVIEILENSGVKVHFRLAMLHKENDNEIEEIKEKIA